MRLPSEVKIFDLVSQFGTYVDEEEVDALASKIITRNCTLKFGAVTAEFKLFRVSCFHAVAVKDSV